MTEVKCPECHWELLDDVYYQVDKKKIIALETFIDVTNTSLIGYKRIFEDREVYPKLKRINDNKYAETFLCPKCNKEFIVIHEEE